MYNKLKELFGTEVPSVTMFKSLLENLPESEQEVYKKAAVSAAFCDWAAMPQYYRDFLTRLFFHDKQKTLNYFLKETVLGSLRYELREPKLIQKLFTYVEGRQDDGYEPSYIRLSFTLLSAFRIDKSVEYYGDILSKNDLTLDDFAYLFEIKNDWRDMPKPSVD
ncbi:MAG: hypothetical protein ACK5N4_11335 [Parabacteroides gordonii]|uniref:hypothetical protein n=1 Tax=Parabacteroides gordonii TaxID=574930 RepID=UPI003A896BB6